MNLLCATRNGSKSSLYLLFMTLIASTVLSSSLVFAQNPYAPPADNKGLPYKYRLGWPKCSGTEKAKNYKYFNGVPNPQDSELSVLDAYLSCVWRTHGSTTKPGQLLYSRECTSHYFCVPIHQDIPYKTYPRPGYDFPIISDVFGAHNDFFSDHELCASAIYDLNIGRRQAGLPNLCQTIPYDPLSAMCPGIARQSDVIHPCSNDRFSVRIYFNRLLIEYGDYLLKQ